MTISYGEAGVVGLLQGVTELFPVSSLGHSVLLPAVVGGRWARDLSVSSPESPYLAFVVGLHVATAVALLVFFREDWRRIITGFLTSIRDRRVVRPEQRLAWLIVLATIPVGISGLLLEHTFRTVLGKPLPAALFLTANGLVLLAGERLRRTHGAGTDGTGAVGTGAGAGAVEGVGQSGDTAGVTGDLRLAGLDYRRGTAVGAAQIAALAPGISRSGVAMVAGLIGGLSHQDAARFSFLLATPVILAAGLLKLPDLFGPLGSGIHGQVAFGSVLSGSAAYLSVRFLTRWFSTNTLTPFAVYSLVVGGSCVVAFL